MQIYQKVMTNIYYNNFVLADVPDKLKSVYGNCWG